MKLMKYTFRTPLFGSIECDELGLDIGGRIELSPEQMCRLYDEGEELLLFLTDNEEDLAAYVPEELENVVLRARFGDSAMLGGRMYLKTYIWTEQELTQSQIDMIQEWIMGQMSDGWGEGLEQREWKTTRVYKPTMYFDEDSLEFEEDRELCRVIYYVNPWNSEDFCIYLDDYEEVEESPDFDVIAAVHVPYHNIEVVRCKDAFAIRAFLNGYGRPDMVKTIGTVNCTETYFVRNLDSPNGVEILNKWAYVTGGICHIHNFTGDEPAVTRTTIVNAVLELLK